MSDMIHYLEPSCEIEHRPWQQVKNHIMILYQMLLFYNSSFCFRYGQVTSVRPLPEKFCAFVNFKTKEAAGRAMHHLQVKIVFWKVFAS